MPPSAWVVPPRVTQPEHFVQLFKAVLAGPAVWTASERRKWADVFSCQQEEVREEHPRLGAKRCVVEAARRAFYVVAYDREEFFGKRHAIYNLDSPAVRGW